MTHFWLAKCDVNPVKLFPGCGHLLLFIFTANDNVADTNLATTTMHLVSQVSSNNQLCLDYTRTTTDITFLCK